MGCDKILHSVLQRGWPRRGDLQGSRSQCTGQRCVVAWTMLKISSIQFGEVAERLNAPVLKTGKG